MQKISPIHRIILDIQPDFRVPGPQRPCPFWPPPSKSYSSNFWLSWIFINTQKSFYSMNSFLRYSRFQCPKTRVAISILNHAHPNIRQQYFPTHNNIWVSNTMLTFRKNESANPKETSGQKDGRTDPNSQDPSSPS